MLRPLKKYRLQHFYCHFLLAQKVTKKCPGNDNSPLPVGIPIKHLFFGGEVQRYLDGDDYWLVSHINISFKRLGMKNKYRIHSSTKVKSGNSERNGM